MAESRLWCDQVCVRACLAVDLLNPDGNKLYALCRIPVRIASIGCNHSGNEGKGGVIPRMRNSRVE
jgi:hypothetical protein